MNFDWTSDGKSKLQLQDEKPPTVVPIQMREAGLLRAGRETLRLVFDANDELPDVLLRELLPPGRYVRLQPHLARPLALDAAGPAALEELKAAGAAAVFEYSRELDAFLESV
ncbi:MAG: hypothetical protein ABSD29_15835 [Verrucomicrobiota bacterium]